MQLSIHHPPHIGCLRPLKSLLCLTFAFILSSISVQAADKIIKVLPQYLDLDGRQSLSPSLYDRDAYQAKLRNHPALRSGLQFQVQWRARSNSELILRLEMRGTRGGSNTLAALESPVKHLRGLNQWTALTFKGEDYLNLGELNAWRVILRDGATTLAEQKSFLW